MCNMAFIVSRYMIKPQHECHTSLTMFYHFILKRSYCFRSSFISIFCNTLCRVLLNLSYPMHHMQRISDPEHHPFVNNGERTLLETRTFFFSILKQILNILWLKSFSYSEISIDGVAEGTDDKLALILIMVWCHQASGHHLNQCWPRYLWYYQATTKLIWMLWNLSYPHSLILHISQKRENYMCWSNNGLW